jgi:hypothetical protein
MAEEGSLLGEELKKATEALDELTSLEVCTYSKTTE